MDIIEFVQGIDLNINWIKVVYTTQDIYFLENGYLRIWPTPGRKGWYNSIKTEKEQDLFRKSVVRIEIPYKNDYYPIWTEIDGIIELNQPFVRLNGKYYTIPFLENLIEEVNKFKKIST